MITSSGSAQGEGYYPLTCPRESCGSDRGGLVEANRRDSSAAVRDVELRHVGRCVLSIVESRPTRSTGLRRERAWRTIDVRHDLSELLLAAVTRLTVSSPRTSWSFQVHDAPLISRVRNSGHGRQRGLARTLSPATRHGERRSVNEIRSARTMVARTVDTLKLLTSHEVASRAVATRNHCDCVRRRARRFEPLALTGPPTSGDD